MQEVSKYWEQAASQLHWFKPWSEVLDVSSAPLYQWFKGGKTNITYNALDRHASSHRRNKVALIWESEDGIRIRFTYFDLWREVMCFANVLKCLDVKRGDRVTLYMPNIPEAIIALLGVARIGAIHVPVDVRYGPFVLRKILQETGSKVLITADGYYRKGQPVFLKPNVDAAISASPYVESVVSVKRLGKETEVRENFYWYHELMAGQKPEAPPVELEANEPLGILYTPNHEGKMVGMVYSHGGYMVGLYKSMEESFILRETDVIWWASELGGIIGQSYMIYGPLLKGSSTVLYEGHLLYPNSERIWATINKYGVSVFGTYPSRLRALMPFGEKPIKLWDISTLRCIGVSGETLDEALTNWLYENIIPEGRVKNLWITAETGVFGMISQEKKVDTPRFQKIFPVFNPEVVSNDGKILKTTQQGILSFKQPLPSMFTNIWQKEALYLQYWTLDNIFLTKDFGERDEDGFIKLSGHRSTRVINIGGLIIPAELVELAMERHSAVVAVKARAVPDSTKGQVVELEISLKRGVEKSHDLRSELLSYARSELGPAVIIRQIIFI
ncbi:MAG: AMP-binding protein [Candidatus Desulfofervidaceae bacterium]|nr:AMP-binding protein [Candidatus Desulfofervidaceae bacterium]